MDGNSDPIARLRRAIRAASQNHGGARAELDAAAAQLVCALREANEPPEQMLLRIKGILGEAGLRPSYATPIDPADDGGADASIYRDVIAFSIHHYYNGRKNGDS